MLNELKKVPTSRAFHAHDTGFYWSPENALHEHFIAEQWRWVWMEMLQLIAHGWKNASLWVWIQLYIISTSSMCNFQCIQCCCWKWQSFQGHLKIAPGSNYFDSLYKMNQITHNTTIQFIKSDMRWRIFIPKHMEHRTWSNSPHNHKSTQLTHSLYLSQCRTRHWLHFWFV